MRVLSVAEAKAQLSSLLHAVEQGEAVEITRRGVAVARLIPAPQAMARTFDLASFLKATTEQPLHHGADAQMLISELRQGARF
ncbi:MAG: type II toxin-antitoxin system prevent-host-death family antitoxin [Synechococcus sp. ELA057]